MMNISTVSFTLHTPVSYLQATSRVIYITRLVCRGFFYVYISVHLQHEFAVFRVADGMSGEVNCRSAASPLEL